MSKVFVDTNVVIDLLDKRMPFCDDAVALFTLSYHKKVRFIFRLLLMPQRLTCCVSMGKRN